jgi:hypothetical protein
MMVGGGTDEESGMGERVVVKSGSELGPTGVGLYIGKEAMRDNSVLA